MKYYKNSSGDVFSYETEDDRQQFGASGLIEMTPEEIEAHLSPVPSADELAADARARRDALLAASDWVTLRAIESGEDVPEEWASYRQALRDVPQQAGFPQTINWPTAPENE